MTIAPKDLPTPAEERQLYAWLRRNIADSEIAETAVAKSYERIQADRVQASRAQRG